MPSRPKKPCAAPGCPNLTDGQYCEQHAHKSAERDRYYDRHHRDKQARTFYRSPEWKLVRQRALNRDSGLCQHCLRRKRITMADMVDHIVPIRKAWHLRLDTRNLQSLCNSCHNKKTAEDKRRYGM
ncbi:HNH endonuclease [Numidum massiliense]|uniref:HNH endonuclease n=1 Tax=Numidum massiliense TaxID=1522315 RepID=UPI0006D5AAE7|nr:HNH endonuclease [Numidum massiliense]